MQEDGENEKLSEDIRRADAADLLESKVRTNQMSRKRQKRGVELGVDSIRAEI